MAETVLCDNCGAPLAPEDGFCGECGAPRPSLAAGTSQARPEIGPLAAESPVRPTLPPVVPSARPSGGRIAAQVIAILSAVISVGLCGLGLLMTLVIPAEDLTMQDRLIGSAVVCFCPGVLALALALVLWLVVVKRK